MLRFKIEFIAVVDETKTDEVITAEHFEQGIKEIFQYENSEELSMENLKVTHLKEDISDL